MVQSKQNASTTERKRRVLFAYPPIPRLELLFYSTVIFCAVIYSWILLYRESRAYPWTHNFEYEDVHLPFGLGTRRKDLSNTEWHDWMQYAQKILPWFMGHGLLFNQGQKLLDEKPWKMLMLIYWLAAHYAITGPLILAGTVTQGVIVYFLTRIFRCKLLTWTVGLCMLYISTEMSWDAEPHSPFLGYLLVLIFPYKMLQYLSFVTEKLDEGNQKNVTEKGTDKRPLGTYFRDLYDMFWYAFYLPYTCHLIVTYKRFPNQMAERRKQLKQSWSRTLLYGLRIAFWFVFAELWTYIFYTEAMMNDPLYLETLRKDALVCLGSMVGQFFHLKYVIIFGLPAFFARLDNMEPFEGPQCISRIMVYSKMWRYFDRGLYDYFKEYIFLPICRPSFSVIRKLFGMCLSFAFVVVWHGFEHQYVVWVLVNMVEILLENAAKAFYAVPAVKRWRETHVSDTNFRRILAWLHIVTFAFGLYSNFYFLGSSEAGYVFVKRIFWEETVTVQKPFLILIALGYCFGHVTMEVDRMLDQSREVKKKDL